MRSTFAVYFFAEKDKQKANGNYPIFVRITIDGVASRFNSKTDVPPNAWNAIAEKAIGRSAEILQVNRLLDEIRASLHTICHDIQRRDNYVTAEKVKNEVLGHTENHDTILNLFQKRNDDVKQLVGISKTPATFQKYEVTRRHLSEFIQRKYNVSDISIKEITPVFITDFELYLRTACKCGANTTTKFMQFFKRTYTKQSRAGFVSAFTPAKNEPSKPQRKTTSTPIRRRSLYWNVRLIILQNSNLHRAELLPGYFLS